MGLSDLLSDLYASLTITPLHADAPSNAPHDDPHGDEATSGQMNSSKDQGSGDRPRSTPQQSGMAGVIGGVSAKGLPHAGTNEESAAEAEVNKEDAQKARERMALSEEEVEQGHKPGDEAGKEAAGQIGVTGLPQQVKENLKEKAGRDVDEDVPEEDEEPEDPKPRLEAECMSSKACSPHKHHYDECAERVTRQIEENGKAKEDCVEEFFHLAHCATNCAAPKLFRMLK